MAHVPIEQMGKKGWVKLHRKLLDSPIFQHPLYVHLWIYILLRASHRQDKIMWNNNIMIVKEGQFITGIGRLSAALDIPPSTLERMLKVLEKEHQIEQQKTNKYRVITILNWKQYQEVDNKRITDGEQMVTDKNTKNIKKENTVGARKARAPKKAAEYTQLGAELIKEFERVDPKNKEYYANKTQRRAADFLIAEYGYENVLKRVKVLDKLNKVPYFPKIYTPFDLQEKWGKLQDAVEQERAKKKQGNNFIL